MGNTHSMNNLSLLDQKRYQTEFLRYSQIPYESQYRPQNPNLNVNLHQYNKFKEPHQMPNPVKVLPDVKFEPKLRSTNNGAILHSGGTISGRKEGECGLHRSKSISETQNTYLSNDPNGMSSSVVPPHLPPQFKMQRASTQLSISHNHQHHLQQQQMRSNLNKNFGSSHDIKIPEVRTLEKKELLKKSRAPPPPATNNSSSNNNSRMKSSPSTSPVEPTKSKGKPIMGQRLFGDTLKNNSTPNRASAQQKFSSPHQQQQQPPKSKEPVPKSAISKIVPPPPAVANGNTNNAKPSRINPISYFRRERTFDMSLTQTQNTEKFKPKFSPQFQRKSTNLPRMEVVHNAVQKTAEIRQMTTQERYKASLPNRNTATPQQQSFSSDLPSATTKQQQQRVTNERMQTIDKKDIKKKQQQQQQSAVKSEKVVEKPSVEAKKSSENSAISNPTMSTSSSFRYTKTKQQQLNLPYDGNMTPSTDERLQLETKEVEDFTASRDSITKDIQLEPPLQQHHHQQFNNVNNFYFGMQEASVDTDDNDDEIENDTNQAQMDAINKFAEDIFKMSSSDTRGQLYAESIISESIDVDSEGIDILINLRPTLPRRQLQIPRFSPLAAWKSLAVDLNVGGDLKSSGKMLSSSMLQLHNEDVKQQETKIERIYREPSFHLQQLDNKSGDSGISADKEIGHSPDSGQMPQAYLVSSWTPQQDLEEDEESEKESYQPIEADKGQSFANSNAHMFSLSLPRDNHSCSDKTPQNNFYSLQKFRKSIVDVFGNATTNDKIQIHNYGADSNWLLGSQPSSMDELTQRKDNIDRNQVMISQMTSGKHVMYLPTNMENCEGKPQKYESTVCLNGGDNMNYDIEHDEIILRDQLQQQQQENTKKSSKNHRFKFQSTIKKNERKKIAEKLSREAEESEMHRLSELEAMQRVEEEFQKKRAREKNRIRHQLRIASLEAETYNGHHNYEPQEPIISHHRSSYDYCHNDANDEMDEIDTRTPYINRIIEAKSPRIVGSHYKS